MTVHQDLCIEDLHEALIPKGKDSDALVGSDLTEYRSVLGKLSWLTVQNTVSTSTITSPGVLQLLPTRSSPFDGIS